MKRIKGFIIFLFVFFTILVVITQPVMHKPVTLENANFKISEELMNPQPRKVSDLNIKVKFFRVKKSVAKESDKTIHIKPDDDKSLSLELDTTGGINQSDVALNSSKNQTGLNTENYANDNYQSHEIAISDQGMQYSDQDINISDQETLFTEQDMKFAEIDDHSNKNLNIGIPQDNVQLDSSDEVGSKDFKGSREEIIAWNVWRSNLQNRIMDESALEAPVGTLIIFSFDVSEDRVITNLDYVCTNKDYAKTAKDDMIRVLKKLQHDSVLEFPDNTKRKKVRFKGGFILDYTTQYSSPSDYSDYERVRY